MDELIDFLFGWLPSSNYSSSGAASASGGFSAGSSSGSGAAPQVAGSQSSSSSSASVGVGSDGVATSVSGNGGAVTGESGGSGFSFLSEVFRETIGGTQTASSSGAAQAVPEMDAGVAPLALAVVVAMVALVYERKKRAKTN